MGDSGSRSNDAQVPSSPEAGSKAQPRAGFKSKIKNKPIVEPSLTFDGQLITEPV